MAAILRTHALKRIWAVTIMFNWLTTLQEQQLKSIHLPQAVHFTHRGFRSVCRGVVEGRPLQENWDKNQLLLDLNLVFTSPGCPENYYWSPSSRQTSPKVMQNCIEGFFSYSFQGQNNKKMQLQFARGIRRAMYKVGGVYKLCIDRIWSS